MGWFRRIFNHRHRQYRIFNNGRLFRFHYQFNFWWWLLLREVHLRNKGSPKYTFPNTI